MLGSAHRVVLVALLVAGCASGPPVVRGLESCPLGRPDGHSLAEWAAVVYKAQERGEVVRVAEGLGWVAAGGITKGDYVDLEWHIGGPEWNSPPPLQKKWDKVLLVAIGRLRSPPPGGTLAEQATALGLTLAPDPARHGVMFRLSTDKHRAVGPGEVVLPEQEDYHDTTNPHVVLLTAHERVTAVVKVRELLEVAGDSNETLVHRVPPGSLPIYGFKNAAYLASAAEAAAEFAADVARAAAAPPQPAKPPQEIKPLGPLVAVDLLKPRTAEQAWQLATTVVVEAMAACQAAIDAGDAQLLWTNWRELTRRNRVAWSVDNPTDQAVRRDLVAYRTEWRKYLRARLPRLQASAMELAAKQAEESEKHGLLATAVSWLYSMESITNSSHSPHAVEDALLYDSSERWKHALHLAALIAVEVVPAYDGSALTADSDLGPIHPQLLIRRSGLATGAKARNLPVMRVSRGPWTGQLAFTLVKHPRTSTYLTTDMVANTEGIAAWKDRIQRLEADLASLGTGDAVAQPAPDPEYETTQEDIYTTGSDGKKNSRLGTVAVKRETARSRARRTAERPTQAQVDESNRRNRALRQS